MEETYSTYQDGCPLCGGADGNEVRNTEDSQECDCGWYANITNEEED